MAKDSKRSKKTAAPSTSAAKPTSAASKTSAKKSTAKSGAAKASAKTSSKRVTAPAVAPMKVTRPAAKSASPMSADERMAKIAEAAYYMAERRHFAPGCELEDWLAAERAVDTSTPRA